MEFHKDLDFQQKPTLRKLTSAYGLPNFLLEYMTKTPGFGVHALPLTSTPNLSLCSTRDDHPSSVDLREKSELLSLHPLFSSHYRIQPPQKMGFSPFYPPFIPINLSLLTSTRRTTCPLWSRVRFCNKTIHFFSIQFILNELISSIKVNIYDGVILYENPILNEKSKHIHDVKI